MPDNGMANETILFDVGPDRLVARLAPLSDVPYPTFPTFDLPLQRDCMELVRTRTNVPLPEVVHLEEDPAWLGTPFLVMRRVDGLVPRDTPPYVVRGWMTELGSTDLTRLEERSVKVLAGVHTVRDPDDLSILTRPDNRGTPLQRQFASQLSYYEWARDGRRVPVIEEAFEVLGASIPDSTRTVLNWGDSRIGNIIYRDCDPVAVLDWEMATAGPPETDVAWMVFMHTFFQDLSAGFGLTGLPDLLRRERVVSIYEGLSAERLDDLSWYLAFAGLRFAIILMRMSLRSIAFGVTAPPEHADGHMLFPALLRRLVAEVPA
jgi:aminoglycoside phosphotransferase (APT) family kinase protein